MNRITAYQTGMEYREHRISPLDRLNVGSKSRPQTSFYTNVCSLGTCRRTAHQGAHRPGSRNPDLFLCDDCTYWFRLGQQDNGEPLDCAGHPVFCANDDFLAVNFTENGAPLCATCSDAYERGQHHPDAAIEAQNSDHYCDTEGCDTEATHKIRDSFGRRRHITLCYCCKTAFAWGQTSPQAPLHELDNVRFVRKGGVYKLVAVRHSHYTEWQDVTKEDTHA